MEQVYYMAFTVNKCRFKPGERGLSALEITLMLPVILILLLLFLQVCLIVQAKFVVNHAAMAAVRSAIVTIPATVRSRKSGRTESHNLVRLNDSNSPKLTEIQRAAAFALTAISPVFSPQLAVMTGITKGPDRYAPLGRVLQQLSGLIGSSRLASEVMLRAPYAYDSSNTKIEIIPANKRQREGRFLDHDEVTVRVTHRYYLGVPGAAMILGKRFPGGGYYINITEQYTLQIEGEPIFPTHDNKSPKMTEIVVEYE